MLIELRGVTKSYGSFTALHEINMSVEAGEFLAIVGKSGSGKSTLLNVIAGIDLPSTGEVLVDGRPVNRMTQDQLATWRGKTVGVVFQFFQLLPTLTIVENVMLPMDFCNVFGARARKTRAMDLLEQFGIRDQANKLPASISGGQQQRAALARALANDPPIIVADEPTGNLDSQNSAAVLELFGELARAGKTVLLVTHEREIEKYADRKMILVDGAIAVSSNVDGHYENSHV